MGRFLQESLLGLFFCYNLFCRPNKKIGVLNMKKIILKFGGMLAALAMVFTTLTVNSTCTWMTYQEELPDTAKKLRKF